MILWAHNIQFMNGRHFAGLQVEAYIADGAEKFKKSKDKASSNYDEDMEDEESKRLDDFGQWLEKEDNADL